MSTTTDTDSTSLAQLAGPLPELLRLVDRRFGPIQRLQGRRLRKPHPAWWVYSAKLSRYPIGCRYRRGQLQASGVALERDVAVQRVLGEAVERYGSLNPRLQMVRSSRPLKASPFFDRFPRCGPHEPVAESLRAPDPEAVVAHVWMNSGVSGERIEIPAGYIACAWPGHDKEPVLTHWISTGSAFHQNRAQAIQAATFEVLERDALMRAWWSGGVGVSRIVPLEPVPSALSARLKLLDAMGLQVGLFELNTPCSWASCVFAVLRSNKRPFATAGCSCKPGRIEAACKALDEAVGIRVLVEGMPQKEAPRAARGLREHAGLYADWSTPEPLDAFWEAPVRACGADEGHRHEQASDNVAGLAHHLEEHGLTLLWADVTPADIQPFGFVVRVVIPEAVPLSHNFDVRWLATKRLQEVLAGRSPCPYSHPFA